MNGLESERKCQKIARYLLEAFWSCRWALHTMHFRNTHRDLPRLQSFLPIKPEFIFSSSSPNTGEVDIITWPIPPLDFVKQIHSPLGQAMLDGQKSIQDVGRLPFWTIHFWEDALRVG